MIKGVTKWQLILIAIVLLQTSISAFGNHPTYDDGYYVAISNIATEQNEVVLNDYSVYNGNDIYSKLGERADIGGWELFIAVLAKAFHIHPAVLVHTGISLFLIPICYFAVYCLVEKIFKDKNACFFCLIIYGLLTFFFGSFMYSSYLSVGIWIGKAVMYYFAFPVLLSLCLDIYNEQETSGTWWAIFLLLIVGVSFSATGVYMMPIFYFVLGIPYLIYLMFKKNTKRILILMKNVLLSSCGIICIAIYTVIVMTKGQGILKGQEMISWHQVYTKGVSGVIFSIYICIYVGLIFCKKHKVVLLLCGSPIILLLTFLNPSLCNFVANSITTPSVYWRVWLCIPIDITIAIGITIFAVWCINKMNHRKTSKLVRKYRELFTYSGIIVFMVLVLIDSGTNMVDYYTKYENMYMIPNEVMEIADYIEESKDNGTTYTILLPDELRAFMRQYTSKANVILVRNMDALETSIRLSQPDLEQSIRRFNSLLNATYETFDITEQDSQNTLDEFGVQYIISKQCLNINNSSYSLDNMIGEYYLYKTIEKGY